VPEDVTINVVKKYNRQLRKIDNGDGMTYDLSGDLYSYTVVMMMNTNLQQNHQQSMAQTCMVTGFVQILFFMIYFTREGKPGTIEPVRMYYDFGIKYICVLFLHMMIRPDLKQAVELGEYLFRPTQMDHLNSSRLLASLLLLLKFSVGIVCETLFILTVSSYKEDIVDINRILITFVIFVVFYEAPLFIFKLKQGNNQLRYFEQLSIYNEIRYQTAFIDKFVPGTQTLQRNRDIDMFVGAIQLVMRMFYSLVFVHSFFYLLVLL
jgi:hypothetical protein